MKTVPAIAALLLCFGCLLSVPAAAQCELVKLRLGLIEQCELDSEELLRAYKLHQALKGRGLAIYTPPKLPNLVINNMREGNGGGNAFIDAQVRVENTGTGSAPPFEIQIQAQFIKLDDSSVTNSSPVTITMSGLAAGAQGWSDWLSSVAYILIPDSDPDYDVVLRAIVDPRNRVVEQNELDNVYEEVCRIPGYGAGQARPLPQDLDFC